jgi:hypothetical protein
MLEIEKLRGDGHDTTLAEKTPAKSSRPHPCALAIFPLQAFFLALGGGRENYDL